MTAATKTQRAPIMIFPIALLLLVVAAGTQIPTFQTTTNNPPVPYGDFGSLEAEAIATYYATDGADMPRVYVPELGSEVVVWKEHVARHGDPNEAIEDLKKGGHRRYDCGDQESTRLVRKLGPNKYNMWLIGHTVIDGARMAVTRYTLDRPGITEVLERDDCDDGWNVGHDALTGS